MTRVPAVARVLVGAAAMTAIVILFGLVVGWVFGPEAARLVSIALYIVGGLICLVGFAGGLRGPMRRVEGDGLIPRGIRRANTGEIEDAMASSAFLIGLGFLAFFAAIVIDPNQRLW